MEIITNSTGPANPPILQTQEGISGLFDSFISWIDRGEKTTRTYLTNLHQFLTWTKFKGITQPTRQDVIAYRQWLATEHEAIDSDPTAPNGWKFRTDTAGRPVILQCKPNTIAQYLRSIAQFFKWAANNGLYNDIAANIHGPKVPNDNHHKEALTAGEVLDIERSITARATAKTDAAREAAKDTAGRIQRSEEQGKRLYAIYSLAVNAGLRTVEISRANVKDFETKGGEAWLFVWGKGRAEADQKKALAPEVAAAITDYLQSRTDRPTGNSPLFVATGNRSKGKRIATTTISTMLKSAMKEAGYNSEKITAHSLRHTTGTAIQQITGNIYTTQKYMRHCNPATTEIYVHTDTARAEAGIAKQLYQFYHAAPRREAQQAL